jgi:hypothetical protein
MGFRFRQILEHSFFKYSVFFFQVYSFCSTTNSNAPVGNGLSDIAVHLDPEDVDHLISKILTCNRDFIKLGVCSNLGSLNCATERRGVHEDPLFFDFKKRSTWGDLHIWTEPMTAVQSSQTCIFYDIIWRTLHLKEYKRKKN